MHAVMAARKGGAEGLKRRAAGTCATTSPRASSLVVRPWSLVSSRSSRRARSAVAFAEGSDKDDSTLGNLDSILAGQDAAGEASAAQEDPQQDEQREEDGFFERKGMSEAQKEKLRREYLGLGGGVNTAMGANYYLYIIVIISALAVAAKLSGAI